MKRFLVIFLASFISLFLISPEIANAVSEKLIFSDEFATPSINSLVWNTTVNGGSVNIANGILNMSSPASYFFPYMSTKINPFPLNGDFKFDMRFSYPTVSFWGSGITFYPFYIWQDLNPTNLAIFYDSCPINQQCQGPKKIYELTAPNQAFHNVSITYKNQIYDVYFDNTLVFTSTETLKTPSNIRLGNPAQLSNILPWSSLSIDYLRIYSFVDDINPILIIPGFGGSFNFEDLILDNHQPISKWTRAPFAPDYDGLIQTIKNAGYIDTIGYPNRNLFVFYYDWRKPIDQISEDLKRFIDTDISPLYPGKSIKILGHSQGGLVARTYIQKYGDATVKQLITAGTPHNGALDAYYVWEGGQIPPAEPLWIRMAYAIYAKTHEKNYPTRKDFIQNNIYSVKDFLPTFSYLLKQDGTPIPETAMTHRNLWLGTLNSTYTPLNTYYSLFTALGGLGENTKKTITVKPQDKLSQLNGVYPDGIPVAFDNTKEGDGSVLLSSSTFPDDTPDVITQTHGGLVNTTAGIGEIMQLLGISQTPTTLPVLSGNVMAFIKHSPISMEITDPNTVVYQDDAIVVVNAATDGRYTINATGTGDGEYSIYAGLFTATGEFWQEFTNTTHTGQKDTYKIQLNTSQSDPLQIEDSTGTIYLQSALTKLVAVQGKYPDPVFLSSAIQSIKDALLAINGNSPKKSLPQVNQAVNSIFSYRSHFQPFDQKVYSQTFSALQDLVQAYTIVSRNTGRPPAGVQTGYAVNVGKYQEELANLSVSDPALNQKTTSLTQANFFLNQAQQKLNSDNFSAAANLLPVFELLHEAL